MKSFSQRFRGDYNRIILQYYRRSIRSGVTVYMLASLNNLANTKAAATDVDPYTRATKDWGPQTYLSTKSRTDTSDYREELVSSLNVSSSTLLIHCSARSPEVKEASRGILGTLGRLSEARPCWKELRNQGIRTLGSKVRVVVRLFC